MEGMKYPEHLVFGLDIGTRSIVGTVGYKENTNNFKVVAQVVKEHETRAMMDGQIHDISKVSETIAMVKHELEAVIGTRLTDVCIAAAGRVLKTIVARAEFTFPEETKITEEHIYSLDSLGVEKAYDVIREETKQEEVSFYCVGYSVIKYYLNDYPISNLEGHKGNTIATELIATFLPEEVIDGLYQSVERAGLYVANLTLEPIAAINVAIPERFRLLNIALVDVGAGTSDICITKDGSIVAYGMIPYAGDELTERIAKQYLTDFKMAEKIKISTGNKKTVTYKDIMGISHKEDAKKIIADLDENIQLITKSIAEKIIELNGNKSVSAVFIVGGGGKIPTFTTKLAKYLNIAAERVALRGLEVLNDIEFIQKGIKKDSLLVTPIGICLNYYEQKNNFIFVTVNGERVKLYDNDKLTIVDAALQIGIQNEMLFPRRGKTLEFMVDGKKRMVRGELGEAAVVTMNGKQVGINHPLSSNDKIEIAYSTVGKDAEYEVQQLPEYQNTICFKFNDKQVICPKFVMANKELVSGFHSIHENDKISIVNYYTLKQVLEFMDLPYKGIFYVNHVIANMDEKIYENFTISSEVAGTEVDAEKTFEMGTETYINAEQEWTREGKKNKNIEIKKQEQPSIKIEVQVNGRFITLQDKPRYIFVDILDVYPFDIQEGAGRNLVQMVNNEKADFTTRIHTGDNIQIYWE
ncbi:MAG: cell division FtsA domain-containing protein [Acetivibrio sp.]